MYSAFSAIFYLTRSILPVPTLIIIKKTFFYFSAFFGEINIFLLVFDTIYSARGRGGRGRQQALRRPLLLSQGAGHEGQAAADGQGGRPTAGLFVSGVGAGAGASGGDRKLKQ